jgi:membrane protein
MIIIFIILYSLLILIFKKNFYFSFLFLSVLIASTDFSNFSVPIIWWLIIIGVVTKKIRFDKNNFLCLLLLFILLTSLISLSFLNGAFVYNSIGTLSKLMIIFVFLLMSYKNLFFNVDDVYLNIKFFIFLSLVSFILYPFGYYSDQGILLNRFSSFLYDANYFSLFCFIFYLFVDMYRDGSSKDVKVIKAFMLFFILISQSLSTMLFFLVYIFISKKIILCLSRRINPYFYFVILIIMLLYFRSIETIAFYDDWQDSYLSMKFNSVIIRLNGLHAGFVHIGRDLSIFLWGMGSGRSLEVFDRVFHNLYFQELFDHGLVYYFMISCVIYKATKNSSYNVSVVIFFLLMNNLIFDNFYIFIFVFCFMIFSLDYRFDNC